jgi:acetoin utilization deacetylase AcuC-like enzyme
VLIVDWDVHHGNGTAEIFYQRADVLYISIHRRPFYPGTGAREEIGAGAGAGYTLNLPVPAGSEGALWLGLLEQEAIPAAESFAPRLILISAGYDAHRRDPLGGCRLESSDYARMATAVRLLSERTGAPVGAILEGGYDLQALGESVLETIAALAGRRRGAD